MDVLKTSGPRVLYTGAGAFCVSNASKSGVRFLTFDTVRSKLPKDVRTGKPTKVASMVAGVVAGVAESVTVVTPGENIKTKMIENPGRFQSTTHAIQDIFKDGGFRSLFRGIVPVTMKQGSNALVRFTSYTILMDTIEPALATAGQPMLAAPVAGAAAGIVTVYATMPFDTLKTKMQAVDTSSGNRGTWESLTSTVQHSGVSGLWRGTTPRLVRLSVSSSINCERKANILILSLGLWCAELCDI